MRITHRLDGKWLTNIALVGSVFAGIVNAQPATALSGYAAASIEDETAEDAAELAKLAELKVRLDAVKERIFQMKTRYMFYLSNPGLERDTAAPRARLIFVNEMGAYFFLESLQFNLDGKAVCRSGAPTCPTSQTGPILAFDGPVQHGNHVLTVEATYRGNGSIFSYLMDYSWKLKNNLTFHAAPGQRTEVWCVGFARNPFTYSLQDRPSMEFRLIQSPLAQRPVIGAP